RTASGSVAAGVTVTLHTDEDTQVASTTTSGVGEYAFHTSAGLAEGVDYRIRIGADHWWPDAASWAEAQPVTIDPATTRTADATVDSAATVTGTIVDGSDNPVSTALVMAHRADTGQLVTLTATAADGTFALDVVEPGVHVVRTAHVDHPLVTVGGATPTTFDLTSGTTHIGTVDITTGTVDPPEQAAPAYRFQAISAGSGHT